MDYSKLGITPIDEQNRAGEDVKYDEDFEKIEVEISKLTSPSASNEIDWALVVKLCENILDTKSKNLLVSTYLCYALFKVRGVEGLSDGVRVLADLLDNFWEILYPPLRRIKGRVNAIEWMLERVTKELENIENVEFDSAKKDEFLSDLKRIDDFLNEKLEDAPLFYNLIKLVDMKVVSSVVEPEVDDEEIDQSVEEEAIVEQPKEEVQKEEVQKEQKQEIKKEKIQPADSSHMPSADMQKEFKEAVNSLNIIVGKMVEAKDYRSELFVINRSFAWLDVDDLPSAEKNKTMLPPPDKQEMQILEKLYEEKDFTSLLWAAESRITTYLFWLDLHFYVAESLKNLGKNQAAQSILEQTRYFITKLPKLQNLTFSDSTPFANKMTKKWLSSDEQMGAEVVKTDKKEKIPCDKYGLDKLSKLMKSSSSVEEEVLYNIELCRCLLDDNNEVLIMVYTKQLLDKIDEYKTYKWKPEIALDAYMASVECLEVVGKDEELLSELYNKIALLKPSFIES